MALSASTVALVLCILFGGVWADRLPRHLVMATMDCVRATSQIGVGVMLLADSVSVPLLLLLQVCFGAAQAFHLPASSGLTGSRSPRTSCSGPTPCFPSPAACPACWAPCW
ncbi:hypothetical protein NQP46_09920 [Streptomyces albus]|nr:hypothetical protein NQP46_09920 [Streptomyces albus]